MKVTFAALALALSLPFFVLPSLGVKVFLSPDENAVSVAGDVFSRTGSFRMTDPLVRAFPWVHPRSLVVSGDSLVPVGFLGMPLLVAFLVLVFGTFAPLWFTPLLALSVVIPLLALTKPWGKIGQIATVIAWMSFPTVILYANRGLFPNLVVVCLAIWATWLVRSRRLGSVLAAGALTAIALSIRPIEIVWVLPWILVAYVTSRSTSHEKRNEKIVRALAFFFPLLIVSVIVGLIGWKTYGAPFVSGYQMHDPMQTAIVSATSGSASDANAFNRLWPFGFHPRNVWWNMHWYLLGYLGPLAAIALGALAIAIRRKERRIWLILGVWTAFILCVVYGQGVYQDHIRVNSVTLANSFLRYTLPLSVCAAFATGYLAMRTMERWKQAGRYVVPVGLLLLVAFGWWTACARDDEGLLMDQRELRRYATIRHSIEQAFPDVSVIVSDRSDKIFFPTFRAAAPVPPLAELVELNGLREVPVLLFIRTIAENEEGNYQGTGMRLIPVITSGNESLYLIR